MIPKITPYPLKPHQFIAEEFPKNQLFLHHTAGNANPYRVVEGWNSTSERICTSFIIGGKPFSNSPNWNDGDIIQCFDEKKWGYHLGLEQTMFSKYHLPYKPLDKTSIGIEVCNWGWLNKNSDGSFTTYINSKLDANEVEELTVPFKGKKYYHKYTDAQIKSLKELILYICDKHKIFKAYNDDIWALCPRAMKGENGIYTHNSVRQDKSDISKQPQIIEMLKTL